MSFLKEVALDSFDKDVLPQHETVYILPSKRSGLFLKKEFVALADKPVFSPTILSIEQLIEEIAQLQFATNTELLFELYLAYKQSKVLEKDNFTAFSKWAVALLQDFNEIDRHLVDVKGLFSYVSEIKKLKVWGSTPSDSSLVSNYLKFWQELEFIYKRFRSSLLNKKVGYQGMVYRAAFENLSHYLTHSTYKKYVFVGFNALNKAESEIIQFLLKHTETEIYWDIDSYFLQDPLHSASSFIRNYQNEWKALHNKPLKGVSSNYLSKKKIEIFGLPKNIAQANFAGSLLKEHYSANEKTALVLSDESLLEPILNAVPKEVNEVNITMGKHLTKTSAHLFFLCFFNLQANKTEKGFFYQDLLDLLSNPYTVQLLSKNGHHLLLSLKNDIKQNNWTYIGPGQLKKLERVFTPAFRVLLDFPITSAKTFAEKILQLATSLESAFENEKTVFEQRLIGSFKAAFFELERIAGAYDFIQDLKSLKAIYLELIANEKMDYQGNPYEGLQIMGMLESRNLDFDTLILTSVNEGILPSGKTNSSFIPYEVKNEFSIPTYREKDAVYAYHFYRLIQRAKRVFLIYNTEPDVLDGGEKSRFITQLLTDGNINKYIMHSIGAPKIKPSPKRPIRIQKTPKLIGQLEDLAKNGFSPSSLTDYIRNPMEFYQRHVLKIDPVQEVDDTIAHNVFGTIVHDALERIYTPFVHQILSPENLSKRKKYVKEIVQDSFEKNLPGADYKNGKNLIVFNVITRYLENFLDYEIKETKEHEIELLALEQKLSIQIHLEELNLPVTLKGKLDRIDKKDGQLRIIDYKTGKVEKSELELAGWGQLIENTKYNKVFQLLCYAEMYRSSSDVKSIKAGIIPIKKSKPAIMLFSEKESKSQLITAEILRSFGQQLKKLILEILNPKISFVEKEE